MLKNENKILFIIHMLTIALNKYNPTVKNYFYYIFYCNIIL